MMADVARQVPTTVADTISICFVLFMIKCLNVKCLFVLIFSHAKINT